MTSLARWRVGPGEVSGAVADLGIFVPLAAALVLINGLSAGMILVVAGVLLIVAGGRFGIPFPVQPLKALTAVAVARELSPDVIHAAGLLIGLILLVLSVRGVADRIATLFTVPVVRALQLGVGILLVITAVKLVLNPPEVFSSPPPSGLSPLGLAFPALPGWEAFGTAFVLLVIPQLPLTFGNAVVAVTDVAHRAFGDRGETVTPARVCSTAGWGNVVSAVVGGMPMCHGSSGLTAHYRLGARTAGMNLLLGGTFVAIGVLFGDQAVSALAVLPVALLALLLLYAGVRHALLVADQRGAALAVAIIAGAVGAAAGNLAYTVAIALTAEAITWAIRRSRRPSPPATPQRPLVRS